MTRIWSKDSPHARRWRGKIVVPCDVEKIDVPDEDGKTTMPGYVFDVFEVEDAGQDLDDPAVVASLADGKKYQKALSRGCYIDALGFRVDCDPESVADFTASMVAYSQAYKEIPKAEVVVRDFDNVTRTITYADYQVMYQALCAYLDDSRRKKWGVQS